jgi:hypothetical protein
MALLLSVLLLVVLPSMASAHHSAAGGAECGTLVEDSVSKMTKGRTDGMVVKVDHQVGCKHLIMKNLVGTGRGESYGYAGQEDNCVYAGQIDAANIFRFYFDVDVPPDSISVFCTRYNGPD